MSILTKILGRRAETQPKVGGMEDFMTLIRVYFQASMAAEMGIGNIAMLPDLRVFKSTFKVATQNGRLGLGERSRCKKMLKEMYGLGDTFFKEIDHSIRLHCRKPQEVQPYFIQFQNMAQDLMMLVGNLMKFKLRLPGIFKKTLLAMTAKTVDDIYHKNDYSDPSVMKSVVAVREYSHRLGFSQAWMAEFAGKLVLLAKKEPRPKDGDLPAGKK